MLCLPWHKKKYYKYNTLRCALGFGNGNVVLGFLSFPPSLPPLGIAFLISCPNPCRVLPLDMRLYPWTLAPSRRRSLLAALTWNCVLYIHVHHCTTLVLLCYQATVSLHSMIQRKGRSRHLLHSTLVASKSTVMALGQSTLRFCTFLFPQDG